MARYLLALSLLRIAFRIVFRVNVGIDNTGCRARMVRRGTPWSVERFNAAQLIQRDTAPVIRRPRRREAAFTFTSVLITENPQISFTVPPQPVGAEQPRKLLVHGSNRPSGPNSFIDREINSSQLFHLARAAASHPFRLRHLRTQSPALQFMTQ